MQSHLRSIESIESIQLAHVVHSKLLRLKRDLYIARQQAASRLVHWDDEM